MSKDKKNREGKSKSYRILNLYERLNRGEVRSKKYLAALYEVEEKTIQRDIEELRNYLESNEKNSKAIVYKKDKHGYEMINPSGFRLEDKEIFALCKIILESRAFSKDEMDRIITLLGYQCEDKELLNVIIKNERFNYVPPIHNKNIIDFIWKMSISIQEQKLVWVKYERQDGQAKEYKIKPFGLVFSEYYFYLVGEIVGKHEDHPVVFRVDRFEKYDITEEKFYVQYRDRFEEGEFRKKIQFMYTGELIKIQFKFWGDSLEAILDRLPTSKVIKYDEKDNRPIVEAEVYGEGVKRWLLSQKEFLEVIRPEYYREEIKKIIQKILSIYQ